MRQLLCTGDLYTTDTFCGNLRGRYPAGTQRPENVLLCSYFGRDVPEHNKTKIGRIRFLTYFGSVMSDMHLASGNIEKFL